MSPAALKARALTAARRDVSARRAELRVVLTETAAAAVEAREGRIDYDSARSLGDATTRALRDLAHAVQRVDGIVSGRIHEGPW